MRLVQLLEKGLVTLVEVVFLLFFSAWIVKNANYLGRCLQEPLLQSFSNNLELAVREVDAGGRLRVEFVAAVPKNCLVVAKENQLVVVSGSEVRQIRTKNAVQNGAYSLSPGVYLVVVERCYDRLSLNFSRWWL